MMATAWMERLDSALGIYHGVMKHGHIFAYRTFCTALLCIVYSISNIND